VTNAWSNQRVSYGSTPRRSKAEIHKWSKQCAEHDSGDVGDDGGMTQPGPNNGDDGGEQQVMVVGPDGRPLGMARVPGPGQDGDADKDDRGVQGMVEEPAKVMRIGTMIKQLLEEVRSAPLDDPSRLRLREILSQSVRELEEALAPELRDELNRLSSPFGIDTTPSDAELRIAQAQLVGWLEGLFQGIQTALMAQQMAARAQLEQMRRGLPAGAPLPGPGAPEGMGRGTGQYL
jgi:hypothetical protein